MKNKGFTLMELLAVIVILGLIALLITPGIQASIRNSRQKLYDEQVERIESAAEQYAIYNRDILPASGESTKISLADLLDTDYITDKRVINPIDQTEMAGCVIIRYVDGDYEYIYDEQCGMGKNKFYANATSMYKLAFPYNDFIRTIIDSSVFENLYYDTVNQEFTFGFFTETYNINTDEWQLRYFYFDQNEINAEFKQSLQLINNFYTKEDYEEHLNLDGLPNDEFLEAFNNAQPYDASIYEYYSNHGYTCQTNVHGYNNCYVYIDSDGYAYNFDYCEGYYRFIEEDEDEVEIITDLKNKVIDSIINNNFNLYEIVQEIPLAYRLEILGLLGLPTDGSGIPNVSFSINNIYGGLVLDDKDKILDINLGLELGNISTLDLNRIIDTLKTVYSNIGPAIQTFAKASGASSSNMNAKLELYNDILYSIDYFDYLAIEDVSSNNHMLGIYLRATLPDVLNVFADAMEKYNINYSYKIDNKITNNYKVELLKPYSSDIYDYQKLEKILRNKASSMGAMYEMISPYIDYVTGLLNKYLVPHLDSIVGNKFNVENVIDLLFDTLNDAIDGDFNDIRDLFITLTGSCEKEYSVEIQKKSINNKYNASLLIENGSPFKSKLSANIICSIFGPDVDFSTLTQDDFKEILGMIKDEFGEELTMKLDVLAKRFTFTKYSF